MNKIQKQRAVEILDNTTNYFNLDNRCVVGSSCKYLKTNKVKNETEGCAIGRLLPIKYKLKIKKTDFTGDVKSLFDKFGIPKIFLGININILIKIQSLHDNMGYWNKKGLTIYGKEQMRIIKELIDAN